MAYPLQESELKSWKLLARFRELLQPVLAAAPKSATELDPRHKVLADDYFCLLLFGLFNPALKSMRALCDASGRFEKMREVCSQPMTPTAFSESQHVFAPEILAGVLRELATQAKGRKDFGDARVRAAVEALTAVDGTAMRALNRMAWAPACGRGNAIKLHLHFSVFDELPEDWTVTAGKVCERNTWKGKVQPGTCYVADRLYGHDNKLLRQLQTAKIDFVLRLCENVTRTPVGPARPLTKADEAAGVVSDRLERLGVLADGPILRVVEIHAAAKVFVLVTTREDLEAEIVGLIYRHRWNIEVFFKWFKLILGVRHWLAESPNGVAIQLYGALIATILLMLLTHTRPTKRQMEAIQLYFLGFASEAELLSALGLQKS